jgi:hypothetical protein
MSLGCLLLLLTVHTSSYSWGTLFPQVGVTETQQRTPGVAFSAIRIVTGVSTEYFRGLTNLVASIQVWHPRAMVTIFDLGLASLERSVIERWNNVEIRWNNAHDARAPFLQNLSACAWKPFVLMESLDAFGDAGFLYVDAGSDVRGSLDPLFQIISVDGLFLVGGQDVDMARWCHHDMYTAFGLPENAFEQRPSYSGGTQGYRNTEESRRIIRRLVDCAGDLYCLAPSGSSFANHRYDQSALSIIAYTNLERTIPQHTKFIAATRTDCHPNPLLVGKARIFNARQNSSEYTRWLQVRTED